MPTAHHDPSLNAETPARPTAGRTMLPDVPPAASAQRSGPGLPPGLITALRTEGPAGVAKLNEIWDRTPFDVAMLDKQNNTLLHLAISELPPTTPAGQDPNQVWPTVGWLLDHGVPVETANTQGTTALGMIEGSSVQNNHPGTFQAIHLAVERCVLARTVNEVPAAPRAAPPRL